MILFLDYLDRQLGRVIALWRRLPEWLGAALILFGIAFLVFARALLRPSVMISGGDFLQFYFWEDFTRSELAQGRLPLWNPYFFSGYPAAANPQMLLFYPPAILLRLLPLSYAFGFGIWLHMGWLGLGMYWLVRTFGASRPAALFSGAALMLSGIFITHIEGGHLEWLYTLAWLPWVVWRWGCLFSKHNAAAARKQVVSAGIVTAGMLLGGALRVIACAGLMVGVMGVVWLIESVRRKGSGREMMMVGLQGLGAGLIAFGLAAPQLLPALELSARSSRAGGLALECATQFSLTLSDFAYLSLARPPFDSFLEWERQGYFGAIGLALALCGLVSKTRLRRLAIAWGIAGLLLSAGPALPFYPLARWLIPFFGLVRQPFTFVVLVTFAGAGLAGLGLDWLSSQSARRPFIIAGGLTSGLLLASLIADAFNPARTDPSFYGLIAWLASYSAPRYVLALLVIVFAAFASRRLTAGLALSALLFDLGLFAYARIPILPATSPQTQAAYLPQLAAAAGRIVTTPYMFSDQSMAVQVANAQGYAPVVVESYDAFVRGGGPQEGCPSFEHADIDLSDARLLQQLSVVEIVAFDGDRQALPEAGPRAWWVGEAIAAESYTTAIALARSPNFDPYQAVVIEGESAPASSDGTGRARIIEYQPQTVTLEVEAEGPGWLVLNDVWYPGWEVTVNEQPAPLYRANGTFRAVGVPAGHSRVRMTMHSTYLNLGLGLMMATILVIGLWAIRSKFRPAVPSARAGS